MHLFYSHKTFLLQSMTSVEAQIKDAENAVLENFDFLATEGVMEVDDDDDDDEQEDDEEMNRMKGSQVSHILSCLYFQYLSVYFN